MKSTGVIPKRRLCDDGALLFIGRVLLCIGAKVGVEVGQLHSHCECSPGSSQRSHNQT